MIGYGIWFLLGGLGGLLWLYNVSDAFDKRELTFDDIKAYVFCLLLGGISLFFCLMMITITFFEKHGGDVAFSWLSRPKKPKREKVIKGLDD